MDRNDLLATAGETIAYAEDYLDTRIELAKLGVAEKGSKLAADAIAGIVCLVLALFAFGCLTMALAIWIGYLVGSYALGFAIVGLIFLIIAGILFAVRKSLLVPPILQALITSLFTTEDSQLNDENR